MTGRDEARELLKSAIAILNEQPVMNDSARHERAREALCKLTLVVMFLFDASEGGDK